MAVFVCEKVFEKAGRRDRLGRGHLRGGVPLGVRVLLVARGGASPRKRPRAPVLGGGYRARNRLRQPQLREAQRAVARAARICAAGKLRRRRSRRRPAAEPTIELVCVRGSVPAPGEELKISYGDKSNEELLFVHGFAERDNPHDTLVRARAGGTLRRVRRRAGAARGESRETDSLDAEIEREAATARLTLLKLLGLPPQVILPATPPASLKALPRDTRDALAVWGATPTQLDKWLRRELDARLGGGGGGGGGDRAAAPLDEASRAPPRRFAGSARRRAQSDACTPPPRPRRRSRGACSGRARRPAQGGHEARALSRRWRRRARGAWTRWWRRIHSRRPPRGRRRRTERACGG